MKKYRVILSEEEREQLTSLTSTGKLKARELKRAMVLLKADESQDHRGWTDEAIAIALDVHVMTVFFIRKRYVEHGLARVLKRAPTGHRAAALDGVGEAHLIALTCSEPPTGHERWTLRLLANRMAELKYVDAISYEAVRKTLKKTNLSLG